eukprot:scaffold74022_cov16-Tisochrysis_lutea.AAC.2
MMFCAWAVVYAMRLARAAGNFSLLVAVKAGGHCCETRHCSPSRPLHASKLPARQRNCSHSSCIVPITH